MFEQVIKRNGKAEKFNAEKVNQVVEWAAEGLDVSPSDVLVSASTKVESVPKTSEIHEALVLSAVDKITLNSPDYAKLAARLKMFGMRKEAYNRFTPPSLYDQIVEKTEAGLYDKHILEDYTEEEINELDGVTDHNRDLDYEYAGVVQWREKYLLQNRVTGELFETPQFANMLIAMCLHANEPVEKRLQYVKDYYRALAESKLSLPTPIMGGVRTPTRQFSSCVLIESGDSLDSISESSSAIIKYISRRAGVGINGGAIRALGSPIRNGESAHTGVIPFWKHFQTAVKSCSQGGMRGGAATLFYPIWHLEVENLLVLKNNRGTEENRIRHMDYGVQLSKLFYQRLQRNEDITLFSPDVAEGELYKLFFEDSDKFDELYLKLEKDDSIRKKTVRAQSLFLSLATERSQTGRIYIQNVDNTTNQGVFLPELAPVRQSNLCVAPETQILTDLGYVTIADLEGQKVNVWNGLEFSPTTVEKTGINQPLIKVSTDSGHEIECTPYHKFYTKNTYHGKPKEVRAKDLVPGDKLIKFEDLPVIEGDKELLHAYDNGMYSGDGTFVPSGAHQRIYLYGDKKGLEDYLTASYYQRYEQPEHDRVYMHTKGLREKYWVPSASYTIQSRLDWLAGYLDADGSVYRNGSNEQLVATSIEFGFLQEVQLMLQTLGVNSKVTKTKGTAGMKKLPKNDGTGELGEYLCKQQWRLIIPSMQSYKLLTLGLKLHRLDIEKRRPARDSTRFVVITEVVDEGRKDDTYCFTEEKRNLGTFNGLLTGQCLEITLPTAPMGSPEEEIALCTLMAFNVGLVNTYEEMQKLAHIGVRALDNLLDYQSYPLEAAEKNKLRRTLGAGIINVANYLAQNKAKYTDPEAKQLIHELMEMFQYSLIKASVDLAKEKGACELFHHTKYSKGLLPVDNYKKTVDNLVDPNYLLDWEALREEVLEHGMRNSTLSALMPSETSSQISNSTNGIEPPRALVIPKKSKDGVYRQIVPNVKELGEYYTTSWDVGLNQGYLELVAIMQKFVDQAISANTNYVPEHFESGKVPASAILRDIIKAYSMGVKTLYYHNTKDTGDDDSTVEEDDCESGACKI